MTGGIDRGRQQAAEIDSLRKGKVFFVGGDVSKVGMVGSFITSSVLHLKTFKR